MTDPTSYEFPATVPSTYGAISTAIIKSVTDETPEGDYKCKTSYTSDNKVRLMMNQGCDDKGL